MAQKCKGGKKKLKTDLGRPGRLLRITRDVTKSLVRDLVVENKISFVRSFFFDSNNSYSFYIAHWFICLIRPHFLFGPSKAEHTGS